MGKKQLAIILSKLKVFWEPKDWMEQHATDSEIAAQVLWSASMRGWVKGKKIADLGAGTGILGIGCLLLEAESVSFVEKDNDSVRVLKENLVVIEENHEIGMHEIIMKDIRNLEIDKYDLVVQNPPFGTKEKHIDMSFLEKAMALSDKIITFHKTETKEFIEKLARENNYSVAERHDLSYPLKKTMKSHKKKVERINVSAWLLYK